MREEKIEIPHEIIHQKDDYRLYIDLFYLNGLPMLTSIDTPVRHRNLVCLKNREAGTLYNGIDKILQGYNKAGFTIAIIRCDNEFRVLMDAVKDELDIEMQYAPQGNHIPEAERNNRTIGKRIRAGYHRLPYQIIPKVMLEALAKLSCRQLNFYPAKNGVSPYC